MEEERKTIGFVTGAQGQRWYEITFSGEEAHAGPTPMARRKDALVGAAAFVSAVNRIGHDFQPGACATVGMMRVSPNSRNVIPGEAWLTIDLRHPEDDKLTAMDAAVREAAAAAADTCNLEYEMAFRGHGVRSVMCRCSPRRGRPIVHGAFGHRQRRGA